MQEGTDALGTQENELDNNDDSKDNVVSMKAFMELSQKVDQMEKHINDLEEENKKLKQNQDDKSTSKEEPLVLQETINNVGGDIIDALKNQIGEGEGQPKEANNDEGTNEDNNAQPSETLSTAVNDFTGALLGQTENTNENAENQTENPENVTELADRQENTENATENENENNEEPQNQENQENETDNPQENENQENQENETENPQENENQENQENETENLQGNENPENELDHLEEEENPEEVPEIQQKDTEENHEANPDDHATLQEINENIQNQLFGAETNNENPNEPRQLEEQSEVLEDKQAREYTYDSEILSIPEGFDLHQQYLPNHVVQIQILPNQTEPTRCLFSATTDINVFDNYCKYLKLNSVVTFHFSSNSNENGTDNYFSFCTGRELATLINPTEDQINLALKSFKESYIIPCSLEDKNHLMTYENIKPIERFATKTMIEYVDEQIKEQKDALHIEPFEYETPLTYSSFFNISIDAYFGYLASYQNDECERIPILEHEYTHIRDKFSIFDSEFKPTNLIGINNVCEIELAPNKFVQCVFSATENNVLEKYLSLIQFRKAYSFHFSSSPNGRVNYFSFCTGNDLITLINPTQNQLNIIFNKMKHLYAIPCGLNDRSQLFFYDYLNKITNIATEKDVLSIVEEINQVQAYSPARKYSYDISSSFGKFLNIAYTTFLGYLIRSQFLEPMVSPAEFTSYNVKDFIPLRNLGYGKTFTLNWQEGKVYVLKKYRDDFKFNQSLYLYKKAKMSRIVPFYGEARNDDNYLVFGFGSRGTIKEVSSIQHLDIAKCRKITIQLVFALAYLHTNEIKPCSISNEHISVDWDYNIFLTDIDDSERVFNCTPEELDISNLCNALYTTATGDSSMSCSSKAIPQNYGPVSRIFELCKKPEVTVCDLVSEILADRGFNGEEKLIDSLLDELPHHFDTIEAFDDLTFNYLKVNGRDINESTINAIKTLKFGPLTTFQFISNEDDPIEDRIFVFETNKTCVLLKNVPQKIVNIVISKMKNCEVAAVTNNDLDMLFEYHKFDLIQHFIRDPQLSVYRSYVKQVNEDMNEFPDKFIVGETLSLSTAILYPSKVKVYEEEKSSPPQFPQISLLNRDLNLQTEMPSNQLKIVEIFNNYILTCLYSTEEDYTFNEFIRNFNSDKYVTVHFSTDEKTRDQFVTFCTNYKLLLMPVNNNNNNNQINRVIEQIKTVKVFGISPEDRSSLFNFTKFDLIQSFADQNEMKDLLIKVESVNDDFLPPNLEFCGNQPMNISSFFKHSGYAITGYYLLLNPDNEKTLTQISASFEPTISFGTSFERVAESSFKPEKSFTFNDEADWKKAFELYNLAAERNDPAAFFNLGLMYSTGQGVEKDKEKAAEYYKKAAELGNQKAQFNLGLMHYKGEGVPEDKLEAARLYQLAADQGNSKAQLNLGSMYSVGDGVEQNYEKAIELFEKAVAQNDADAQLNLGRMIELGQGTPVDKERVVDLYTKSADNGNAKAQFNLGVMYHNGIKGVIPKDNRKAINYYSMAASQGLAKAQFNLGVLYSKGDTDVPVDKKRAVQLFQLAADQGDEDAQLNLGAMYSKGEGVSEVNKSKTFELYKKAAKQGNAKAQFNLAVMYQKGDGIDKNNKKAAKYYQKASDQDLPQASFNLGVLYFKGAAGVPADKEKAAELFEKTTVLNPKNSKALYNLAIMHLKGEGVEKNEEKAREYFEKAAELNNKDAFLNLGLMYTEGTCGVRKDKEKAVELYERAAELGSDKAQLNLGLMYQKGEGCDMDKEKAKEYYTKAANQGNTQAQINLGLLLLGGDQDDQDQAKQYLLEAAKEGNVEAMVGLARRYQLDEETKAAIKWYSRAANSENAQAQLELGQIYLNGDGIDADLDKAENLFNRSFSNKSDQALLYLGDVYEKRGKTDKAGEFYQRALDAGVDGANERINRLNQDSTSEPFKEPENVEQREIENENVEPNQNEEAQAQNQNEDIQNQNEEAEDEDENDEQSKNDQVQNENQNEEVQNRSLNIEAENENPNEEQNNEVQAQNEEVEPVNEEQNNEVQAQNEEAEVQNQNEEAEPVNEEQNNEVQAQNEEVEAENEEQNNEVQVQNEEAEVQAQNEEVEAENEEQNNEVQVQNEEAEPEKEVQSRDIQAQNEDEEVQEQNEDAEVEKQDNDEAKKAEQNEESGEEEEAVQFNLQVDVHDAEDEDEPQAVIKSRKVESIDSLIEEEDEEGAEAVDEEMNELFNSLENRIIDLHNVSSEPYKDFQSALDDVDDKIINMGLNKYIKGYSKINRSLQIIEDEVYTFLDENKSLLSLSSSSNLPSLNRSKSQMSSDSAFISDDEELSRLKYDVHSLEKQISQINQTIHNMTRSGNRNGVNKNNSSSSQQLPQMENPKKIQQPSDDGISISPRNLAMSPRSARTKIKVLQKRVKSGDPNAEYLLGACYALGQGVSQDKEMAFRLYSLAAKQGIVNAQYALGSCYSYGKGTEVDKKKAFKCYLMAAEKGHDKSQFAVGHFYEYGQGVVEPNHEEALKWYKKAAAQGHQPAIETLKNVSDSSNNE